MLRLSLALPSLVAALLFGAVAVAADPLPADTGAQVPNPAVPEPRRPADDGVPLLDNELIQLKVKLTEEQRRKIEELLQMARQDLAEVQDRIPSQQQREAIGRALRLKADEVVERYREQAESILTPQQQAQLRALALRWRGMTVLNDPDVARELGLTQEQREKISFLIEEADAEKQALRRETRRTGREGRVDRRTQTRAIDAQLNADLRAVLTAEQRERLDSLQSGTLTPPPPPEDPSDNLDLGRPAELGAPTELGAPADIEP